MVCLLDSKIVNTGKPAISLKKKLFDSTRLLCLFCNMRNVAGHVV